MYLTEILFLLSRSLPRIPAQIIQLLKSNVLIDFICLIYHDILALYVLVHICPKGVIYYLVSIVFFSYVFG